MHKYNVVKVLGRGGFGCAMLVTRKDGKGDQLVVKEVRLSDGAAAASQLSDAMREAELLKTLKHPNIIGFVDSFSERIPAARGSRASVSCLYIVMEFADGGDLSNRIAGFKSKRGVMSEDEALNIFMQMCLALKHMHDRHILHRDLKTANVFLMKSGVVKLGDLGIAKTLSSSADLARTQIGTPYYLSPEVCCGSPYGKASDMYALGVCLYEMLTCSLPFNAPDLPRLVTRILAGGYTPLPRTVSKPTADLVAALLARDPRSRPTVEVVLHRYLKSRLSTFLTTTLKQRAYGQALALDPVQVLEKARAVAIAEEKRLEAKRAAEVEVAAAAKRAAVDAKRAEEAKRLAGEVARREARRLEAEAAARRAAVEVEARRARELEAARARVESKRRAVEEAEKRAAAAAAAVRVVEAAKPAPPVQVEKRARSTSSGGSDRRAALKDFIRAQRASVADKPPAGSGSVTPRERSVSGGSSSVGSEGGATPTPALLDALAAARAAAWEERKRLAAQYKPVSFTYVDGQDAPELHSPSPRAAASGIAAGPRRGGMKDAPTPAARPPAAATSTASTASAAGKSKVKSAVPPRTGATAAAAAVGTSSSATSTSAASDRSSLRRHIASWARAQGASSSPTDGPAVHIYVGGSTAKPTAAPAAAVSSAAVSASPRSVARPPIVSPTSSTGSSAAPLESSDDSDATDTGVVVISYTRDPILEVDDDGRALGPLQVAMKKRAAKRAAAVRPPACDNSMFLSSTLAFTHGVAHACMATLSREAAAAPTSRPAQGDATLEEVGMAVTSPPPPAVVLPVSEAETGSPSDVASNMDEGDDLPAASAAASASSAAAAPVSDEADALEVEVDDMAAHIRGILEQETPTASADEDDMYADVMPSIDTIMRGLQSMMTGHAEPRTHLDTVPDEEEDDSDADDAALTGASMRREFRPLPIVHKRG